MDLCVIEIRKPNFDRRLYIRDSEMGVCRIYLIFYEWIIMLFTQSGNELRCLFQGWMNLMSILMDSFHRRDIRISQGIELFINFAVGFGFTLSK